MVLSLSLLPEPVQQSLAAVLFSLQLLHQPRQQSFPDLRNGFLQISLENGLVAPLATSPPRAVCQWTSVLSLTTTTATSALCTANSTDWTGRVICWGG